MNIIHVLYDNPHNPWLGGGAAKRAQAIEQCMIQNGHTITYISGGFPGCEKINAAPGIRYEFTPHCGKYVFSRLLFSLFAGFKIKKYASKANLLVEDVSIFNLIFPKLFWHGKMVSLIHNYLGKQSFKKLKIFGVLPYLLERHIFASRKNYVTVSEALKQNVLQFNKNANVQVIYNGIDKEAFKIFSNSPEDSLCTAQESSIASQFKIGFIGRLEINQKGLDILVRALQILFEKHVDWRAVFIGGGKDENALCKLTESAGIRDRVEITGRMGSERFAKLAKCNVACMPSRFEGWGITAIEAAALGIPVIGSNIEGLNEAVINGKTGLLLNTNSAAEVSAAELASAIEKLQGDTDLYNALSANAKSHAKKFNWNDIAKEQLAFYENAEG